MNMEERGAMRMSTCRTHAGTTQCDPVVWKPNKLGGTWRRREGHGRLTDGPQTPQTPSRRGTRQCVRASAAQACRSVSKCGENEVKGREPSRRVMGGLCARVLLGQTHRI